MVTDEIDRAAFLLRWLYTIWNRLQHCAKSLCAPALKSSKLKLVGAVRKQLEAILAKVAVLTDKVRKWVESGVGFAAGTLVHTKEGLVPIEQVKVGEFVLSRHDSGKGKRAYKQVLKTSAHASQRVIQAMYQPDPTESRSFIITCSVNHPFWVKGLGWTPAEDLYLSSRENWLKLKNDRNVRVTGIASVYVSDQPGVGWLPSYYGDTQAPGALWDFINHRLVAADVEALDEIQHHQIPYNDPQFGTFPQELYLHLPVYNLEVEDFHTYYVGQHGVWVHDTNCDGLNFEPRREVLP